MTQPRVKDKSGRKLGERARKTRQRFLDATAKLLGERSILDISETGARLHLLETVWPPNDFILELADGRAFLCETVRQEATIIGVAFVERLPDRYLN